MRDWTETVAVADAETRVRFEPSAQARATVVFGHGAGTDMDHPRTRSLLETIRRAGCHTASYNFLYRMKGKGGPDRMPKLKACLEAVAEVVRSRIADTQLLLGGHSMGGRVASMLQADGYPCDGLLLLGYPLHPSGKPEQLRTAHLASIDVPVLGLNGTRDKLCTPELMRAATDALPHWTQHWLEGADHSYDVLKRSGRTADDVQQEIGDTIRAWLQC